MDTKVAEDKPKPIKYQVFLGETLQRSLERYIQENYPPDTSVKTIVFRKAIAEFLEREGYYENPKEVSSGTKD